MGGIAGFTGKIVEVAKGTNSGASGLSLDVFVVLVRSLNRKHNNFVHD